MSFYRIISEHFIKITYLKKSITSGYCALISKYCCINGVGAFSFFVLFCSAIFYLKLHYFKLFNILTLFFCPQIIFICFDFPNFQHYIVRIYYLPKKQYFRLFLYRHNENFLRILPQHLSNPQYHYLQ